MELQQRLQEDMKAALKAGQKDRLSVIRMLLSDVKNIDLDPKKPTAEQAVAAYAKKLRKSLEEFEKYGKTTEAAQLKSEIEIVDSYLPKKLSADETSKLIDDFLAKNTFTEKQMGQAMGMFIKQQGGNVDPGTVNQLIKQKLTGK
jgi:hypothetical protein